MNDEFLYKLRRAPPSMFARQLKTKLDRASREARRTWRVGLFLFLCGSAFALISPNVRHTFVVYFRFQSSTGATPIPARKEPPPPRPPAVADRSSGDVNAPSGDRPTGVLRNDTFAGTVAQTMPADSTVATPAPSMSPSTSLSAAIGSATPTPEQLALEEVATRQGLFKVMGWTMAPLTAMLKNEQPFDAAKAEKDARRIAQLSVLIGDVFRADTRAFRIPTQARTDIWPNLPDFDRKADDLTTVANSAATAAQAGDRVVALRVISAIGTACEGCHDRYRDHVPTD